jgi:S-ribosylhomocysteine lyase LuxS involved in autoinducer biosynthesis
MNDGVEIRMETVITGVYGDGSVIDNNAAGCMEAVLFRLDRKNSTGNIEMYEFIRDFKGEVPGASPKDCGNYLDMNLSMANYLGKKYLDEVLYGIDESRLVYPE